MRGQCRHSTGAGTFSALVLLRCRCAGTFYCAGILLVVCLFGMPIGFARFTRQLLEADRLRDPAIKSAFGNVYDAYKDSHVDFEAYSLLRRGLAVVSVVLARNNSVIQATVLMALSLVYFFPSRPRELLMPGLGPIST